MKIVMDHEFGYHNSCDRLYKNNCKERYKGGCHSTDTAFCFGTERDSQRTYNGDCLLTI
jgi:hypothetical protein